MTLHAPPSVMMSLDALRMEQVLTNVLDNAIKYSPGGGAIEVTVTQPSPEVAQVAVRDHGLGIPPEQRAHIFKRFYQAHTEHYLSGLGLGLYISQEIVTLHGGHISVDFPLMEAHALLSLCPPVRAPHGNPRPARRIHRTVSRHRQETVKWGGPGCWSHSGPSSAPCHRWMPCAWTHKTVPLERRVRKRDHGRTPPRGRDGPRRPHSTVRGGPSSSMPWARHNTGSRGGIASAAVTPRKQSSICPVGWTVTRLRPPCSPTDAQTGGTPPGPGSTSPGLSVLRSSPTSIRNHTMATTHERSGQRGGGRTGRASGPGCAIMGVDHHGGVRHCPGWIGQSGQQVDGKMRVLAWQAGASLAPRRTYRAGIMR